MYDVKEMESKRSNPNFLLYKTLLTYLKNYLKNFFFEVNELIKRMLDTMIFCFHLKVNMSFQTASLRLLRFPPRFTVKPPV